MYHTNVEQTIITFAQRGGWVVECEMEGVKDKHSVCLLCIVASSEMLLPGYSDKSLTSRWQSSDPTVKVEQACEPLGNWHLRHKEFHTSRK